MGIGVQNTPSGMQSQVLFLADRFAVMTQAGGTVTLPFVIQNGQTFIRDTFIRTGPSAMPKSAAIFSLQHGTAPEMLAGTSTSLATRRSTM
jgi:predicted phage tail protein